MKNWVADLLNLNIMNNCFKVVFWKKNGEHYNEKVKELDNLYQSDIAIKHLQRLELLSVEAIPEVAYTSYFMREDFRITIKTKIVLNVKYEEE